MGDIDLEGSIKSNIGKKSPVYVTVKGGYTFYFVKNSELKDKNLKGEFYYGLGAGIELKNFVVELLYDVVKISNFIEVTSIDNYGYSSEISLENDLTIDTLSLMVGIKIY